MRAPGGIAAGLFYRRFRSWLRRLLGGGAIPYGNNIEYWEERALILGRNAVLDSRHGKREFEEVTAMQKKELLPLFRGQLTGEERLVLDLGCGPGRFTVDLARLVGGRAVGADPVLSLLELAPRDPDVEYRQLVGGVIPMGTGEADVVWISLVLGGVEDDFLPGEVREIERVLRSGGLLFLVENTSEKPDGEHWKFRSVEKYASLFPSVPLVHLHDYRDLDERMSVMAGRKAASSAG
jgi:SAM-dependent methyltransferase